jgi:Ca-activated chloride channel family protein
MKDQPRPSLGERVLDLLAPWILVLAVALPFAIFYFVKLRHLDLRWDKKTALWLVVAAPFAAWVFFHLDRTRVGTLLFSRTGDLRRSQKPVLARLLHLPDALRVVTIALVALAIARPQHKTAETSEVEGIDIVVTLDVSNSMHEADLVPDRIGAAKRVIDDFIKRRPADRIGLVLFGREAFTQCPLTLDHRALRLLLADVRLGLVDGQGTAIGNALATAVNRLRDPDCSKKEGEEKARCEARKGAKSKVIVLVTDGDDNASKIDPRTAARLAHTFGIRVFTILIGRDVLAANPGNDPFGLLGRARPRYPVNPRLLEEIADATDGIPYLATDTEALQKRFQAIIDDLQTSHIKAARPHYAELYPLFVAPAIALVLVEILLSLTRFRRFP